MSGLAVAMLGLVTFFQNCADGLPDNVNQSSKKEYGISPSAPGTSCKQILAANSNPTSGVYFTDPDGLNAGIASFQAYCDMTSDGGGWMLVARNNQTTTFTNFDRVWADYKNGFGTLTGPDGLGWLGNDRLHAMTSAGSTYLKVVTNARPHLYAEFKVDSESNMYRLSLLDTAASDDGGAFLNHSQMNFTTSDKDNDTSATLNCATQFKAGWWYGGCYSVSLAGNDQNQVYWRDPAGAVELASYVEMWIR